MARTGVLAACIALVGSIATLGTAGPANADYRSGDYTCGGLYAPRLQSNTLGVTTHQWRNNSTLTWKITQWPSGGARATVGYAGVSNYWQVDAGTINSKSLTCVN